MAVHIENVSSTVSVTDGSLPLRPEVVRQLVEAVLGELRSRDAREERAARDRRLGRDGGAEGDGCGCGGARR